MHRFSTAPSNLLAMILLKTKKADQISNDTREVLSAFLELAMVCWYMGKQWTTNLQFCGPLRD